MNPIKNYKTAIERPTALVVAAQEALTKELQEVAHNISSATTSGYKSTKLQRGPIEQINHSGRKIAYSEILHQTRNNANGQAKITQSPFDICLVGEGHFAIQTSRGVRYTRNGHLTTNEKGILISASSGDPILSTGGQTIQLSKSPTIREDGTLLENNKAIANLKVVTFNNLQDLHLEGDSLINTAQEPKPAKNYRIMQGNLEESNVNPISELISMISIRHQYEQNEELSRIAEEMKRNIIKTGG